MERVYDEVQEEKILQEFSKLKDVCYLDHAGATLYSDDQIGNIGHDFMSNLYGNPHSLNLISKQSSDLIDQVRRRILRHFHTSCNEYSLIFTSGATAAIELLFKNFDWEADCEEEEEEATFFDSESNFFPSTPPGAFVYTQSNHTSVVGAREIAKENKIPFFCLEYEETYSLMEDASSPPWTPSETVHPRSNSLFAYPAQCNFSGKKYPLEWIEKVQSGILDSYGLEKGRRNSKWFCLLDAATYCATNDLNLSEIRPDFVCISFYKIFGYPTGLGCLLVKNSSGHALKKSYFGGGTVDVALPFQNFHKKRRVLHERFEDGTISFLSIISLEHGLNTLNRLNLTMSLISRHVFELAKYAVKKLKALIHWNGSPAVELYADSNYDDIKTQGGIVNFNLKRANRQYIGYMEVLHAANLQKIYIRSGCFCNLGACQRYLKLRDDDLKLFYWAGHVCGDAEDLMEGKPTGSLRVSFGYMTTQREVDKLVEMIRESFVEVDPQILPFNKRIIGARSMRLSKIQLFPIKSCGAMEVDSWKLNSKGLEKDREWMIITSRGVCLTQKQEPKLCMIRPKLNLKRRTLTLAFGTDENVISIPIENERNLIGYDLCESKVCNSLIRAFDCGDEVSGWLCRHLNAQGLRLVRQAEEDVRISSKRLAEANSEFPVNLSLSNQAQFLMMNNESVHWLQEIIGPDEEIDFDTFSDRFRGNFYIDGGTKFSENNWKNLTIGKVKFRVEGPCRRCQMICVDQKTGEKSRKPLTALSRALSGKLQFGIYLSRISPGDEFFVRVGDSIEAEEY